MFRRRNKKPVPPGTFIPTPARICAIIHLCLAFTVLFWNLSQPFSGDLFAAKSSLLIFDEAMGIPSSTSTLEEQQSLDRQTVRFQQLPQRQQNEIRSGYHHLQKDLQRPFLSKCARALHLILFDMPLFEKIWLLLSFILPILLLKRVEGAQQALWLLPLLAMLYAVDNRLNSIPYQLDASKRLFPTEEVIIHDYLKEPLDSNLFIQREQLKKGWELYLIDQWAHQAPSDDVAIYSMQVEEGSFAFQAARALAIAQEQAMPASHHPQQEPIFLLAAYLFWNLLFACVTIKTFIRDVGSHAFLERL